MLRPIVSSAFVICKNSAEDKDKGSGALRPSLYAQPNGTVPDEAGSKRLAPNETNPKPAKPATQAARNQTSCLAAHAAVVQGDHPAWLNGSRGRELSVKVLPRFGLAMPPTCGVVP